MKSLAGLGAGGEQVQFAKLPGPWKAYLFPVPSFPVQDADIGAFRDGMQQFADRLMQRYALNEGLVLQSWKLSGKHGGDLVQQRAEDWPFDLGFGVWPDRPAPEGWTEDSIQDAAAAVYRGDEPNLPMHRILLFTIRAREVYLDAVRQLSGFGAAIQIYTRLPLAEVRRNGHEELLPRISDRRFRGGRVYLPLLDSRSLQAAKDVAELEAWLCGVEVYMRESAEDKGLLVVSRLPIEPVLDELGWPVRRHIST